MYVYETNEADAEELLQRQIIPVGARTDGDGSFTFPLGAAATGGTAAAVQASSSAPAAIVITAGREEVSMFDLEPRDFTYVCLWARRQRSFPPEGRAS